MSIKNLKYVAFASVSGKETKIKGYKDRVPGYSMQILHKNVAHEDLYVSYPLLCIKQITTKLTG
jgi:hypothetical protein